MASKKKGKKGSGGGNSNKPIKYQPVFHPEDVDDVDDNDIVDYVEEAKDFDQLVRDTEDYGFERDNQRCWMIISIGSNSPVRT